MLPAALLAVVPATGAVAAHPPDLTAGLLTRGVGYGELLALAIAMTATACVAHYAVLRVLGRLGPRRHGTRFAPRWLAFATLGLAVVLGATAAVGFLRSGELAHGALFAHVGAGGAFVVALAALVAVRGAAHLPGPARDRFGPLAKLGFWVFAAAGTLTAATMMAATLPWFGTIAMERLFAVHRLAGLVTVAAAVVHAYGLLLGRGQPAARPSFDRSGRGRRGALVP